jgi:hypothetical protein
VTSQGRTAVERPRAMKRVGRFVCATALVLAAACEGTSDGPSPAPLPGDLQSAVGPWNGPDGESLPTDRPFVMDLYRGPTHCDWQDHLFLILSWPLGTQVRGPFMSSPHTHMFVRTSGSTELGASLATTFQPDAELPTSARDTGFTREGWHLWVVDSRIDVAVWLVNDDIVERWPAATEMLGCA